MVSLLRRLFAPAKQPEPFAVATGRQLTVDSSRLLIFDKTTQWNKLDRYQKLWLYEGVYRTQEIATAGVNLLTRFIATRMIPKVDNPDVARRMIEIWEEELDGPHVLEMLVRSALVFGYSAAEWVSNDLTRIDKLVVPPSCELRVITDRLGNIDHWVQLPGFSPFLSKSVDGRVPIPALKMIPVVRDPLHSFGSQIYGDSILCSCLDQFESLCKILDSQIRVFLRMGRPRFLVSVPAEGLTPEQLEERIDLTKRAFASMGEMDASDLYLPDPAKIEIIGAQSFGQRFRDESQMVLSQIAAGIGVPASLMNLVIQQSGNTESFVRQQVISLLSQIESMQRSICHAFNRTFWQIVGRMERMPEMPRMGLGRTRLLEETLEQQGRALKYQQDKQEVIDGIRPEEWLAQQCGVTEAYDIDVLREQIANARASSEPQPLNSPDAAKPDSTTKATDERATGNTSI